MKKGYPSDQATGKQKYGTLQPLGAGRYGSDVTSKALSELQIADFVPEVIPNQLLSDSNIIQLTAHPFRVGDAIRINAGSLSGMEAHIVEIIDANQFKIGFKPSVLITPADTFAGLRPTTIQVAPDGSLVTTAGPVLYVKDGLNQEVTRDTAVPSNNAPLPVEIIGAAGQDINITAGDLNVQLSHTGATPDSTRIGDGVTELGILPVTKEAKVSDAEALIQLTALAASAVSIDGKVATEVTLATLGTEVTAAAILAKLSADPSTETTSAAILAKISADASTETTLAAVLAKIIAAPATEAKQDDIITALGASSSANVREIEESVFVASQPLTTGGLVGIGTIIPAAMVIREIEIAYKDGATLLALFDGVPVGMVTQGGNKIPVNLLGDGVKRIQLQAVGADVTVADLMVNIIK